MPSHCRRSVVIALGGLAAVGTVLRSSRRGPPLAGDERAAFVAASLRGPLPTHRVARPGQSNPRLAAGAEGGTASAWCAALSASLALAGAFFRASRTAQSSIAMRAVHDRKWWHIPETEDPTTLPLWKRDWGYAYRFIRDSMRRARRDGKKIFWEMRVLKSFYDGCKVECLKTGFIALCPKRHEGETRLKVGETYMMECLALPMKRIMEERFTKRNAWPRMEFRNCDGSVWRPEAVYSHHTWLEVQRAKKLSTSIIAGDIVDGVVYKHLRRGILLTIRSENGDECRGILDFMDVSRKKSNKEWCAKMFPEGTKMRAYVIHSDRNGRITLSTKEFEDDAHVGWMLSFPERCMARAEKGIEWYNQKKAKYIWHLQQ